MATKKIVLLFLALCVGFGLHADLDHTLLDVEENIVTKDPKSNVFIDKEFFKIIATSMLMSLGYQFTHKSALAACSSVPIPLSDITHDLISKTVFSGHGLTLACAARLGSWPKLDQKDIINPLLFETLGVVLLEAIAGIHGLVTYKRQVNDVLIQLPDAQQRDFVENLLLSSTRLKGRFGLGVLGSEYKAVRVSFVALLGWILWKRYQLHLDAEGDQVSEELPILPAEQSDAQLA